MAKRTAKKKAAGDGSSATFGGPGFTTQLRNLLRAGSPTRPSLIPPYLSRSPSGSSRPESESSSTSAGVPPVLVTVTLPTGERLDLRTNEVEIDFDRDTIDVTLFGDRAKTYAPSKTKFTIRGEIV